MLAAKTAIPDLAQLQKMIARFQPTELRADLSKLSPGDARALAKLVEAARVLNELMPEVPKILFTLHAQALMMADLKTAGIDRVVSKSDMTDLIGHSENLVKAA